ncbi:MAG: UDP-N-acetylglucosamine 2-epimerase (hydrolyzing) [Gammaproteobacteria bacterium]|nr:UDP-N-acetylglucosamine 2-epimerase (hydrolyzing) [Gammaproteobacteria bacterium]|tara:strand:- start:629 stop:1789 length:1161 start_codon:yes stop_codon:yes gene_type:complete
MRRIAVFTGTRAEYGLLSSIIKGLDKSPNAELALIVGGMHLSSEFGYTVSEIENDGIRVSARLEFLVSSETSVGISKSMGLAIISAAEYFERERPDILVLLGDRFEAMAVAQAAMIARIPIAHIHGGEITEGLIDEAIRHSITKMSHLHFASTDAYAKRIHQLGENPDNIFNFGAPGVDNIRNLELLTKEELSESIEFNLNKKYILVTHHPVTLSSDSGIEGLCNLLSILDEYPDYRLIISYPNADTKNRAIIELLEKYYLKDKKRTFLTRSLGVQRYLSAVKHSELVVGNSSSGLIEAPTLGVPTVNIGDRQKGRIHGDSVLNCDDSLASIRRTMTHALSSDFRQLSKNAKNPYGDGQSSGKILDMLIKFPLENIIFKQFYDLEN